MKAELNKTMQRQWIYTELRPYKGKLPGGPTDRNAGHMARSTRRSHVFGNLDGDLVPSRGRCHSGQARETAVRDATKNRSVSKDRVGIFIRRSTRQRTEYWVAADMEPAVSKRREQVTALETQGSVKVFDGVESARHFLLET